MKSQSSDNRQILSTDDESKKKTFNGKDLRIGNERRQFSYTAFVPERRSGKDRRQNKTKLIP